jgi:predicted DNA-binding transcriptional regulator AlpA
MLSKKNLMNKIKAPSLASTADLFDHPASSDLSKAISELGVSGHSIEEVRNDYAEASQSSSFSRKPPIKGESEPLDADLEEPAAVEPNSKLGIAPKQRSKPVKTVIPKHQTAVQLLPRAMTVSDVANYIQVSVSTVWRLVAKDPIFPQPGRIGGSTRWDQHEIDRYLDRRFDGGRRDI